MQPFHYVPAVLTVSAITCIGAGASGVLEKSETPEALSVSTLDAPWGHDVALRLDSGPRGPSNRANESSVVFADVVHVRDAAWMRLYFQEIVLEGDSRVRFTSLLDGQVQELDAAGVRMWGNTSAYFNGDSVLVELIASPGTRQNRLVLDRVAVETRGEQAGGARGMCGIWDFDDRTPSDEQWSGRLGPVGCTASVFNTCSCILTAGHCVGSNSVVQFNVPNSLPNCDNQHPPVSDQFPLVEVRFHNGGPGSDWAVMTTGTNDLGQTIYERYGEYRPIAATPATFGDPIDVWGYGNSENCILDNTQQHSPGFITNIDFNTYRHTADTTGGNSGSGFMYNGEIIGIVTHCATGNPNLAQRVDWTPLQNAIQELCSCIPAAIPGDINNDGTVDVSDLLILIGTWGPCSDDCPADIDENGVVNVDDLLLLLGNWG